MIQIKGGIMLNNLFLIIFIIAFAVGILFIERKEPFSKFLVFIRYAGIFLAFYAFLGNLGIK